MSLHEAKEAIRLCDFITWPKHANLAVSLFYLEVIFLAVPQTFIPTFVNVTVIVKEFEVCLGHFA